MTTPNSLTISGISQAGGGNVLIENDGNITISGAVATGGGNFNVMNAGSLAINNTVDAGTGNVTLTSTGAISDSALGAVTATLLTAKTINDSGTNINLNSVGHVVDQINLQVRNAADTADANGTSPISIIVTWMRRLFAHWDQ